jgi:hypothetical protein
MDKIEQLKKFISHMQEKIRTQSLDSNAIKIATEALASIGYKYDANQFPELKADEKQGSKSWDQAL